MPGIRPARTSRWLGVAVMALTLIPAAGCGGRGKYPVEGKVVFRDGSPCTWGLVMFDSLEAEVKTSSRGHIQKDGSFFMSTEQEKDGVPEGRYRVCVTPLFGVPGAGGTPIHSKYWSPETSPLVCTVIREKNQVTFEMDPAPAKQRKIVNDP